MARARILAAAATLVLFWTAGVAHAENARPRSAAAPAAAEALTVRGDFDAQAAAAQPNKILQWDTKKGRWGLKLGLGSLDDKWKNLEAGAFFRITPSLRVGGSVGLRDRFTSQPQQMQPQDARPRVHLETAFRF